MKDFCFNTSRSLVCECGASLQLPSLLSGFGAQRIQIITDQGILQAGLLNPVMDSFKSAGIAFNTFADVTADPLEKVVLAATEHAKAFAADLVIGFGGGSSMDVAKLVAVLAHSGTKQTLSELYGIDQVNSKRLPLVQIPTTAGTGSEVTPIAIVTTGETTKAGVVSPVLQADLAILDATLTLGLPPAVTAATCIDAMVHAIEAFTSVHKKNPLSDLLAMDALRHMSQHLRSAVHEGSNLVARQHMLYGAMLAGQAFANAPVAAVHALAYPLGGHFHIPHGLSNSLVLPHVLRFNAPKAQAQYAQLSPCITSLSQSLSDEEGCDAFIAAMDSLIKDVALPTRLRDCGVAESDLSTLAADAMLQQRLLINNPRTLTEDDALAIYRAAY